MSMPGAVRARVDNPHNGADSVAELAGSPNSCLVRVAGTAIALALVVALPAANLAIAGMSTVTCCCGEHAGDHDCGCADCPGSESHRAKKQKEGSHEDGLARTLPCKGSRFDGAASGGLDWFIPPSHPQTTLVRSALTAAPPGPQPSSRVLAPDSPPS